MYIALTRVLLACAVVALATAAQLGAAAAVPNGNLKDRVISASTRLTEIGPVIAINPVTPERVVVGFQRSFLAEVCPVRSSMDGGNSWAAAVRLPLSRPDARCTAIDLVYAGDGRRLFAAYVEAYPSGDPPVIAIAVSEDDGQTWERSPAVLSLPHTADSASLQRLATPRDPDHSVILYLVATTYVEGEVLDTKVVFLRSTDSGSTWSAPRTVQAGSGRSGTRVEASRPAEGNGGDFSSAGALFKTRPP